MCLSRLPHRCGYRHPLFRCDHEPGFRVILSTVKNWASLVTFTAFATLACHAATLAPASPDVYVKSIQALGGNVVNPMNYPQTVEGFQAYLQQSGVKAVTAQEMTRPNHPEVAARHGFTNFLPQRDWWPRGAALALLTQKIDVVAQASAHLRNWWRPAAYNTDPAVKGAKSGDHPTANAVDLDYDNAGVRMKAEAFLRSLAAQNPWMQLSLGLGAETTHVGIGSPRGHREWHYAGWQPAPGRKTKA